MQSVLTPQVGIADDTKIFEDSTHIVANEMHIVTECVTSVVMQKSVYNNDHKLYLR